MALDLTKVKNYVKQDGSDDNTLLTQMLAAAQNAIANETGVAVASFDERLEVAALMLIGHWYENRLAVVTGTIATEIPFAIKWLCWQQREWTV